MKLTPQQAYRRAGGRRKHNAVRQLHAKLRQNEIARLLRQGKFGPPWGRGFKSALADHFNVAPSTIGRDIRALEAQTIRTGQCPVCGKLHSNDED